MYKYFSIVNQNKFNYYEKILQEPNRPYIEKDWEWTYDFPQIRRKAVEWIVYLLKIFILYLVQKLKLTTYLSYTESNLVEINVKTLEDFILKALKENMRTFYQYKCMIIFGPDVKPEIHNLISSFDTLIQVKYAFKHDNTTLYFLNDVPLYYIPTISGIHILPDLTGKWSEKIYNGFEETTAEKLRHDLYRFK